MASGQKRDVHDRSSEQDKYLHANVDHVDVGEHASKLSLLIVGLLPLRHAVKAGEGQV